MLNMLMGGTAMEAVEALAPFGRRIWSELGDSEFDFLYLYPAQEAPFGAEGVHVEMSRRAQGFGKPFTPPPPPDWETSQLLSLVAFNWRNESPLNHETMHKWGVHLDESHGFDGSHWGVAGTYGVLGGFDPHSLVDHGDESYTVAPFATAGNDWLTTGFSDIELYLMGLLDVAGLQPIPVLRDRELVSETEAGVRFKADLQWVTGEDIVAANGAREPGVDDSQKAFRAAFVVFSEEPLADAELAYIDERARGFGSAEWADNVSFEEAARGLATMDTRLP